MFVVVALALDRTSVTNTRAHLERLAQHLLVRAVRRTANLPVASQISEQSRQVRMHCSCPSSQQRKRQRNSGTSARNT